MSSKLMLGLAALAALSSATPVVLCQSVASNQLGPNQPDAMLSLAANDRDASALFCGLPHQAANTRVVGGNETSPGQYPWMVNIKFDDEHICGGAIISDKLILTVRHCFKALDLNRVQFYIGDYKQFEADGELVVDVDSVVLHPRDDFALVKTRAPIEFRLTNNKLGSVNRICLPRRDWKREAGAEVIVAGWGETEDCDFPNRLRQVGVSIKLCRDPPDDLDERVVCATSDSGKDSCVADSGGPLMLEGSDGQWELVGLVQEGPEKCGLGSTDAIYANVHHYLQWIIDNH